MGFGEIRAAVKELRQETGEFRRKLRAARADGEVTPQEREALKPELLDILEAGAELLGASADTVREVKEFLEKRL